MSRNPNPNSVAYWDESELRREIDRVFDVCSGCRRCFNLCDSFPYLFDRMEAADDEAPRLTPAEIERVVSLCFQCKVCGFQKCPYTPPHDYQLDFPKLMLRAKAVRARKDGFSLRDKLLTNIDRVGPVSSAVAPLVNFANRNPVNRWLMHHTVGIHKDKILPAFHSETFAKWFGRNAPPAPAAPTSRVALFHTCTVNYNAPDIGKAAVAVLSHNGVDVAVPEQRCCGMPFYDVGDIEAAKENARANLASLSKAVAEGRDIVVPMPTCSLMIKHEYPYLLGEEAKAVADRTYDLCEYLMRLHAAGKLRADFPVNPGTIAYHVPCHLRDQKIGHKSAELMRLIPGATVVPIEWCSGHDGTWSMKTEFFEQSMKVGGKVFAGVEEAKPDVVASDCALAGNQIQQGTGRPVLHPIQIVARAYGLEEKIR
jgi:Fe-S oxidoreductase